MRVAALTVVVLLLVPSTAGAQVGQTKPAKLVRTCDQVKLVEHKMNLLDAPLIPHPSTLRPLITRYHSSSQAFAGADWIGYAYSQDSSIQVVDMDGGTPRRISPEGKFCWGSETKGDGLIFTCKPDRNSTEGQTFHQAVPPDWETRPASPNDWSHNARRRDAVFLAEVGFANHDAFDMDGRYLIGLPKKRDSRHPFVIFDRKTNVGHVPAKQFTQLRWYAAMFRDGPRTAAILSPATKAREPRRTFAPQWALYVLDAKLGMMGCVSEPHRTPLIAGSMGASGGHLLYLRSRLPIHSPLELHLADVDAGINHHLGSISDKTDARIHTLPDGRFLVEVRVESPRTKFTTYFLLVDSRDLSVRQIAEPMPNARHQVNGTLVSPSGTWLLTRYGTRPSLLPIPGRTASKSPSASGNKGTN